SSFSICVSRQSDDTSVICPPGYSNPVVFYGSVADTRSCSACSCSPAQGSTCSSSVTIYADSTCSAQLGSIVVTSPASVCLSFPPGSPLGSKKATTPTYHAGSCQASGGVMSGSLELKEPATFCCQQ